MNEKLIENIKWLDKTLVEFDSAVESYRDVFNKKIRPSMILNVIKEGQWEIEFLNFHLIIRLEDVLDKAEIKNDSITNKVFKYIDTEMSKFINNLKINCI